jgi:predicted O-methyltransferase YrrM
VISGGSLVGTGAVAASQPARPLGAAIDYFASGLHEVRGFLTRGSAYALLTVLEVQRRDGIHGPLAEIGTFLGKSLIGFGLAAGTDETVVGVDLFLEGARDFEAELRANWRRFDLPEDRLRLHRGSSADIDAAGWAALLGAPARLVHVDGEHTRVAALHDLGLSASALGAGGVIVVDDVLHPWYPDITLAAGAFLDRERDLRAFALVERQGSPMNGGAKLFVARAADVERYDAAFRACVPASIVGRAAFAGSNPLVLEVAPTHAKALLAIPPA